MIVVTTAQMRAVETAQEDAGIPLSALAQRAGEATAVAVAELASAGSILVLAGPGNNGGDGIIAARLLTAAGLSVTLYTYGRDEPGAVSSSTDPGQSVLRALLASSGCVVDALLGTGQTRPVTGDLAEIVRTVNEWTPPGVPVLAVDIPTGISADTGQVLGTAIIADATLALGFMKYGLVLEPGRSFAGELTVADIGIDPKVLSGLPVSTPSKEDIAGMLPARPEVSNKGTFGRVLVVAGSDPFLGAPCFVSLGALRSGAGLAEVVAVPDVRMTVAARVPEVVFLPVPSSSGHIGTESLSAIRGAMEKANSLVYGPGLGLSPGTVNLIRDLLPDVAKIPAVLDADGLNALAQIPDWWEGLRDVVVTPHPGEMSRLTGLSIDDVQADRIGVARRHAQRWGVTVVLKGAGTLVATPDGRVSINTTGGPNLATGGTGDVLSGIIGGLLAQGASPEEAAVAGVYLHGRAGDLAAETLGDAGTLAGDLPALVPVARAQLEEEV